MIVRYSSPTFAAQQAKEANNSEINISTAEIEEIPLDSASDFW